MKTVILHISDLHVSQFKGFNGTKNEKLNSFLSTNEDQTESNQFIRGFVDKIKSDFIDCSFKLLVTGDIADKGESLEYTSAEGFLRLVMDELLISPEDLLLIPGDHDICRRHYETEIADKGVTNVNLLNSAKFRNFSSFYQKIKGKEFDANKIIFDNFIVEDKIAFIAINSNAKIGSEGGEGYIDIEKLYVEIESFKNGLSEEMQYVACWHHNITAGYENTNNGQWDVENRKQLIAALERINVKLVLSGNEHICQYKPIGDLIMTSDSGAFTVQQGETSFKAYVAVANNEVKLENCIYYLRKPNSNDFVPNWLLMPNVDARHPDCFELFVPNEIKIPEVIDLPISEQVESKVVEEKLLPADKNSLKERVLYRNGEISERLYSIIKDGQLFHSGHFHWSETSRAHNWIDIAKMLEKNDNLYFAQSAIVDVVETFELQKNCNLVIGLGYEGNLIANTASIKFNIPYTFLPYSYRYNDHHDFEKRLNFENSDGTIKTVLIITDVVNDGRTIRKLIKKREKDFFDKVSRVIVVSLVYTGQREVDIEILNSNKFEEGYDKENDHEVNNIEFYTVKTLRVEKCPYSKNFREECFIYKDQLSCVHLFYDEKIAMEKEKAKLLV